MKSAFFALALMTLTTAAFANQSVAPSTEARSLDFVFSMQSANDSQLGLIRVFDYENGPNANPVHLIAVIPTGEVEGDGVITREYELPGNFSELKGVSLHHGLLLVRATRTNINSMKQENVTLEITYKDAQGKGTQEITVGEE